MRISVSNKRKFNQLPIMSQIGRIVTEMARIIFILYIVLHIFDIQLVTFKYKYLLVLIGLCIIGFVIEVTFDKKRKLEVKVEALRRF
ncbi:hypothetical protein ACFYKX_19935 [Cytobacillus sp. FJAT-54145]|uniref:Uncharacterized protein n=1 Tax=Cytobacillus spartinae TaxID=3299023 RepID=A0ABW6KF34_9BACI